MSHFQAEATGTTKWVYSLPFPIEEKNMTKK